MICDSVIALYKVWLVDQMRNSMNDRNNVPKASGRVFKAVPDEGYAHPSFGDTATVITHCSDALELRYSEVFRRIDSFIIPPPLIKDNCCTRFLQIKAYTVYR